MFFDLGETYSVIIEQYIGNTLVSRQQTAAPKEFLMMQFMGLRMVRYEEEWNQLEQQVKRLEFSIEFRNNRFGG